jgi:hypothetical protein
MVKNLFARGSKSTSGSKVLEAARGTTATAVPATGLRACTVHEPVRREACQGGLDDMACSMFIGVFIDEAIGATGRDSGREDPLSLGAGPLARLFAQAEGFDSTGG